jgi:short-subunit dehydrogenase
LFFISSWLLLGVVIFNHQGFAGLSVYCGTKFFVEGMSQAMCEEVAQFGIKMTFIQPGNVNMEMYVNTTDMEVGT